MKYRKRNMKDDENMKHIAVEQIRVVTIMLILYDIVAVTIAYYIALWLRFDCHFSEIPIKYFNAWLKFAPIYAVISIMVMWILHLYQSIWKFASFIELRCILVATVILGLLHIVGITLLFQRMPISYYVIGIIAQFTFVLSIRFAYRFLILERNRQIRKMQRTMASRAMLVGAGSAGQMILRDLHNAKEVNENVCCIIDDDHNKWGCYIDGVPVVGGRDDILLNVEKYRIEKIFLAIPSATAEQRRDILNICKVSNCELKNIPGFARF